jgi:hypothetical protein
MTEHQRKAPGRPAAERYYAELVRLPAETDAAQEKLQGAIHEGAEKKSWRLIGVAQAPAADGLFLVWDTSGFFSG